MSKSSIQALREERAQIAAELQNLVDKDKTPTWDSDKQAKYDNAMTRIDEIDAQINRYQDAMNRIADGVSDDVRNEFTRDKARQEGDNDGFRAYLIGGFRNLSDEQIRAHSVRQAAGDIRAAMSTTTGAEGGYTVAPEYQRQLLEKMKLEGGIRSAITIFQSQSGADLSFPAADATSEEGEIVGQNRAASSGDTSFMPPLVIKTFKYSSKSIALPFELIQDSMFDIEAYIQSLLRRRLGRITNKHFTIGNGTSEPHGLITAATVGKVGSTGSATSITYDDLVDLEHSVDPFYRGGSRVGFMMHDSTLKAIRKIKDGEGRPIFVPGYEQSNPLGAPDRLLNRPIYINQHMAEMEANAKSLAFGDFSYYMAREVMDLTMFRMTDSKYTESGQVGFIAFTRMGGNLIDVGGAVKLFQNSAS